MANENIQELKFQVGEAWKGVYSSSTAYGLANVVQDPTGLSIYRSLKSGNVGHPVSDRTWWFCIIDLSSIKAESDRIAALNEAIAQDEALRVAAEELRQQHEAARVAAETQRNEAEQARISAEQARVNAESARATAEQQRITAEQGRVSAESARVQAEQARVLAETLRANAEDARAANEQNRVAAEQQRIANEQARETQYAADHSRAEADHETAVQDNAQMTELVERADADHVQAASDHTRADSDHTTAAADHTQAGTDHTTAAADHEQATTDHTSAESDHTTASADHQQAVQDHETATVDHNTYAGNVLAAQTAAQNAAASAETSAQKAAAAAGSAAETEQYVEDIMDAIDNLPDGQAVSAQVAVNTADIAGMKPRGTGISFDNTYVSARTATIANFVLSTNIRIDILFTTPINAADATLNVSLTGAKPIRILGQNLPAGVVKAQTYATLVYDGTAWNIVNLFCPDASFDPAALVVDMGLPSGVKWASRDIDLTKPGGFCETPFIYEKSFFSWGNIDGHNPSSVSAFDYNWGGVNAQEPWYDDQPYGSTPGNTLTGNIAVGEDFDAARANLGAPWRMPTNAEFAELFANIKYINADGTEVDTTKNDKRVNVNGVMGLYLESRINGARLFFSCSGFGYGRSWDSRGSYGDYWSSTWYSSRYARYLYFYSGGVHPQGYYYRYGGFALRPVQ